MANITKNQARARANTTRKAIEDRADNLDEITSELEEINY